MWSQNEGEGFGSLGLSFSFILFPTTDRRANRWWRDFRLAAMATWY
jgi:hypothetical protein